VSIRRVVNLLLRTRGSGFNIEGLICTTVFGSGFKASIPDGWLPDTVTAAQIRAKGWIISPAVLLATNVRRKQQGIEPLLLESTHIGPARNDVFNGQLLRVRIFPRQDIVRFDCPQVEESAESVARLKREGSSARKNR
jgi:hypothetical protein